MKNLEAIAIIGYAEPVDPLFEKIFNAKQIYPSTNKNAEVYILVNGLAVMKPGEIPAPGEDSVIDDFMEHAEEASKKTVFYCKPNFLYLEAFWVYPSGEVEQVDPRTINPHHVDDRMVRAKAVDMKLFDEAKTRFQEQQASE